MPRALITGGFGYIGGHLALSLLKDEWEVSIIDTLFNNRDWNLGSTGYHVACYTGSVTNSDAVGRALDGANVVYHLASRCDWKSDPRHPIRLFMTNVHGTATLLAMARAAGVDTVVFASSYEVYGNVTDAEETLPMRPTTLVGATKMAAEAACRSFTQLGMNVVVLRLYNVWGGVHDRSVVTKFLYEKSPTIFSDGTQTRDFVHISDVVVAMRHALKWEGVYNIGTSTEVTIDGLWHMLRDDKPRFKERRVEQVYRSSACIDRVLHATKWQPRILLSELERERIRELCVPSS